MQVALEDPGDCGEADVSGSVGEGAGVAAVGECHGVIALSAPQSARDDGRFAEHRADIGFDRVGACLAVQRQQAVAMRFYQTQ
ncbi:hypothetical protein [Mangrovihabitans endophyticus]|uniref:Uncharacterized protein n=1 Tax=Mangrovihabitans endophyticus TaxID=1751298 RepID=A0A8J3FSY0_9ACTN|nr:hypothetical protein [Mangrovihabitans endophyticus]GGL17264.1 hypothetical protein GCM10012284_59800 [Mangrovihabitans endophyticus]